MNLKKHYKTSRIELINYTLRHRNQTTTQDHFGNLLNELEDQKYNLAQSSDAKMHVIDYIEVLKAIGNFKELLGL